MAGRSTFMSEEHKKPRKKRSYIMEVDPKMFQSSSSFQDLIQKMIQAGDIEFEEGKND